MTAPVWVEIAGQLILLDHLHVAALIFVMLVTYMHPSEILVLRQKGLVPSRVPLLPCWSVVIETARRIIATTAGFS